jgi:hypothetical protein
MAVISLLLPLTFSWPRTMPRSVAKALTMWIAVSPPLPDPRTVLPSTAMLPLKAPTMPPTQRRKALSNCFGSRTRKTRRKVSSEGTPFVSKRNLRNHASFARPQYAMSSTVSQSDSAAATAITSISRKSCSVPLLGLRGSSISLKQFISVAPLVKVISVAQKTRVDPIPAQFTSCWHNAMNVNDFSPAHGMPSECGSPGSCTCWWTRPA